MTKAQRARRIKQIETDFARWEARKEKAFSRADHAMCSSIIGVLTSHLIILDATVEID